MSTNSGFLTAQSQLSSLLTPPQLEAVLHDSGDSLILAGAGSGKTRVLIYKIVRLVSEQLAAPDEILAVTFTNKAAGEMRERAEQYLGYPIWFPWLGTFHSICVRIMRRWLPEKPSGLFRSRHFSIYDNEDSKKICALLIKKGSHRVTEITARSLFRTISNWKSDLVSPEEALRRASLSEARFFAEQELLAELYGQYEEQMRANNALDFDDLLLHATLLLERDPEVLGALRSRFRYIFVDEYQDTNAVQYRLVKLLSASPQTRLTVVGDDDQSIYGWRGADVEILRNFVRDFSNAQVFKLEENFRSSAHIVTAAGAVIGNNSRVPGLEKHVFSKQPAGDPVRLIWLNDDFQEARRAVEVMRYLGSSNWSTSAVFYRTNAQSRLLEKAFAQEKIPCRIYGGVGFYQRKEIKDLFAYLTLLVNRGDEVALRRIINVPRRAIGEVSVSKIALWAAQHNLLLIDALAHGEEILGRSGKKVEQLSALLGQLSQMALDLSLPELVEQLIERTGYRAALLAEGTEESTQRAANVDELLNDVQEREENSPGTSLEEFVGEVALATDADREKEGGPAVLLMTLHASKGLEFDNVVIVGCEELFLPGPHGECSVKNKEREEEERRLFYVGMTRAKIRLWLMMAGLRRHRGREERARPSRFLAELDPSACHFSPSPRWFGISLPSPVGEHSQTVSSQGKRDFARVPSQFSSFSSTGENSFSGKEQFQRGRAGSQKTTAAFEGEESQENLYLSVGSRVRHPRFGAGVVLSASGSGPRDRVNIRFADGTERCLVLEHASLTITG